jgi:hypothetical protein
VNLSHPDLVGLVIRPLVGHDGREHCFDLATYDRSKWIDVRCRSCGEELPPVDGLAGAAIVPSLARVLGDHAWPPIHWRPPAFDDPACFEFRDTDGTPLRVS